MSAPGPKPLKHMETRVLQVQHLRAVPPLADGLNPFQSAIMHALAAGERFILADGPTSSGKTHVLRHIAKTEKVITLFPTRTLSLEQIRKLDAIAIGQPSRLIGRPVTTVADILEHMERAFAEHRPVVATPDALYLLVPDGRRRPVSVSARMTRLQVTLNLQPRQARPRRARYNLTPDERRRLVALLTGAVIAWDEQHALASQVGHLDLLRRLFQIPGLRVLALSGTPVIPESVYRRAGFPEIRRVYFHDAMTAAVEAGHVPVPFQPEIRLEVVAPGCAEAYVLDRLTEEDSFSPVQWTERMDRDFPGRHVLVFEALDRVEYWANKMRKVYGKRILRWDSWTKSPEMHDLLVHGKDLPQDAIVMGTSALDLGIDPGVRNLWSECPSVEAFLQRIGRLGRPTARPEGWIMPYQTVAAMVVLRHQISPQAALKLHNHRGGTIPRAELAGWMRAFGLIPMPANPEGQRGMFLRKSRRQIQLLVVMPDGRVVRAGGRVLRLGDVDPTSTLRWPRDRKEQREAMLRAGVSSDEVHRFMAHQADQPIWGLVRLIPFKEGLRAGPIKEERQGNHHVWVHAPAAGRRQVLLRL